MKKLRKKKKLRIRKCPRLPLDCIGVSVKGHRGKVSIAFSPHYPAWDGHW